MDNFASNVSAALLMERLVRDIYPSRGPKEIQPLQWAIMRILNDANETRHTPKFIAHYLNLTPGTITRATKTLDKKGLIESSRGRDDRRSRNLRLTEIGLATLHEDPIFTLGKAIGRLSEQESMTLRDILRKLVLGRDGV